MHRGDLIRGLLAEGERHHQLAAVVQQPREVRKIGRDRQHRGGRGGNPRDGDRVHVHLPPRHAAVAGRGFEEAEGDRLEAELAGGLSPDHHHRLTHGLGLDRAADVGGVGVAQQVHRQRGIGLERRDEVAELALLILGEREHALDRAIHHGQPAALGDRLRAERGDLRVEL